MFFGDFAKVFGAIAVISKSCGDGIKVAFKHLEMLRSSFIPTVFRPGHCLTRGILCTLALLVLGGGTEGFAQAQPSSVQLNVSLGGTGAANETSVALQLLLLFSVLSLAPSLIIMMTSFTRIVVVLSFLRTALGIQQPSSQILVALSLFMTGFIMYPVFSQIDKEALTPLREKKMELPAAIEKAGVPIKAFMLRHAREKDIQLFSSMMPPESAAQIKPGEIPFQVLVPAFMVSELRTAFQMGFTIFLPFLVIDMVVSSILMAMGMMMLPPTMVTLPTKILVFVLADGWGLIVRSLVESFR